MKICIRGFIILAILILASGFMFEYLYASPQESCSCCNNKCQGAKNCHETTKACLCSYLVPLQVHLLKSNILLKLLFSGYFTQRLSFSYVYLPKNDIFHPPKIELS